MVNSTNFPTLPRTLGSLVLIQCLFPGTPALSQPDPVKWGKVSDEELEMSGFPDDSLAHAVILVDFGDVAVDRRTGKVTMKRHQRIKILTAEGYEAGNVDLVYTPSFERIDGIKAQTVYLDDKGKKVRQKLDKGDVFEESVTDDLKRIRFTLPALTAGAVIEYSYNYTSEYPTLLPRWSFQYAYPAVWSEFRAEIPPQFQYVVAEVGSPNWDVVDRIEANRTDGKTNVYRWVLKDAPAIRAEPYMTTPVDYRASIQLQLSAYQQHGYAMMPLNNTWDRLANTLNEGSEWRDYQEPQNSVKRIVESLIAGRPGGLQKLDAIHSFLRTTITWNYIHSYYPSQRPGELLESNRGTSADINLMLVSMAKAAGLQADPVLISTRSHGRVLVAYPLLDQFDYVIAAVKVGGKTYLVDATDKHHPYTTLPFKTLNDQGWVVQEGRPVWIKVSPTTEWTRSATAEALVDENGSLEAALDITDSGYKAAEDRAQLEDVTEIDFLRDAVISPENPDIKSCQVLNRDSVSLPVRFKSVFRIESHAQVSGDYMYLNPTLVDRLDENPFKQPERRFPVDFVYQRKHSYRLALKVPEEYEVLETPQDVHFQSESGGTLFSRHTRTEEGAIVIETRFDILRVMFKSHEYRHLRDFFDRVVKEHATQIVLRRKDTVEPRETGP